MDTPIWQLTVGEFMELQKASNSNKHTEPEGKHERKFVYGISGLAELLGCSNTTAQKVKNSGRIDRAYTQVGRQIIFDSDMVIELLNRKL